MIGRLVGEDEATRVLIRDGRVVNVSGLGYGAGDSFISAGWVDLQINGCGPHDANALSVNAGTISAMVRGSWRSGITGMCITVITESEDRMTNAFRAIVEACEADPLVDASVLGIHVEGPHISREEGPRGVHPVAHVRPPDIAEYHRWQEAARGRIKIVTLSPEYEGAGAYIRELVADGVVASIGHTGASGDQINAAVDAGARASTHLGNGSHAVIPRHPNYIWDQLNEDRLSAGFVFDGHLLPPSVMKPMLRAKGIGRSFLVSDAVALAGIAPGTYESFSGAKVELTREGRLEVFGSPYLAGAIDMLPVGIANAVKYGGVSLADALLLVTRNPSQLLGLSPIAGHEAVLTDCIANLTVFDHDEQRAEIRVIQTIVTGKIVYSVDGGHESRA